MSYDANSIQFNEFAEACRRMPGMYLGADGQDGVFNCFLEILNNSCDEAIMGRGNKIEISVDNDSMTIKDYGAGIPHGANDKMKEVLIGLFTTAHSSGKFDTKNYKKVRGLHGVGSSAVCVCSKEFNVITRRDGYSWSLNFKDGIPQSDTAIRGLATTDTGTTITFIPDKDIFHITEGPAFNIARIREELELTSYFIPKIEFVFKANSKTEKFCSQNGLRDFAKSRITKPLHKNYIYGYKAFPDEVEVEVFAQWTGGKEECYIFSNGALNKDGGVPVTGAKTAFTRTINTLSKGEFDADMIRKGLVYIVNIRHPHPIYENQVKSKIQNQELRGYTQTVFSEAIKEFVAHHNDEFSKIVEILTKEKRAEAAAEKARQQILNAGKEVEKNQKKKVFASDKLKDAEYLGENSTLLIVEGDSALGGMAQGRDYTKYGLMAIRGKIINCLSNTDEKIFQNEEIKLLLSAMNIVPGKYNSSKLRYGKLAICTDADSDGYHIGLLIMAALAHLAPEFIKEGRLCWLRSPLYIVDNKGKESYYFTDEEFNKAKSSVRGTVTRAKGLGELPAETVKSSMFTPEYQRMDVIEYSADGLGLLYDLMGEEVEPRRDFIMSKVDFSTVRE